MSLLNYFYDTKNVTTTGATRFTTSVAGPAVTIEAAEEATAAANATPVTETATSKPPTSMAGPPMLMMTDDVVEEASPLDPEAARNLEKEKFLNQLRLDRQKRSGTDDNERVLERVRWQEQPDKPLLQDHAEQTLDVTQPAQTQNLEVARRLEKERLKNELIEQLRQRDRSRSRTLER